MKKLATVFLLVIGLAAMGAATPAKAGPDQLTPQIKQGLMDLKPLRGSAVDQAMFGGKPLLVVFFASW